MGLESLSSSQFPNVFALLCAVILAAIAMRRKPRSGLRLGFLLLGVAFAAVVVAKNVAYTVIVSRPHAEGSLSALHDYAGTLKWVAVAQLAIGLCTLGSGLLAKGLGWVSAVAAIACSYAAMCMLDWRHAYLSSDLSQPVRYVMTAPLLHVAVLVALVLGIVASVVSQVRRP